MAQPETHNFRLLAHDTLGNAGNIGEGVSLQVRPDGRRVVWMAHECAPKNFTAVDVTNPTKPRMILQTELPHRNVRSNSLEVCGDTMAVAYQTGTHGATPAGVELFDISTPEQPRSISFVDRSGPRSRGVHQLWFVDGKTIHCSSGAADFMPRNLKDDQCYTAIDVSDPVKPRELGRWWYPGTEERDAAPPVPRHPKFDTGWRAHNTNVYPERPDRAYVGYIDGGACVLDISDIAAPKLVGHWNPHPPFPGFTHTVMPLFDRDLLVVSDECVRNDGADWPKLVWIVDNRAEENPTPIATCPMPPVDVFSRRGGRFGAHNLWENLPKEGCYKSDRIVFGTFFNGGLRAFDLENPYQPKEVAYFVPEVPGAPFGSCQLNDVFIDDRGIVYTVDRFVGGLYCLEMDF